MAVTPKRLIKKTLTPDMNLIYTNATNTMTQITDIILINDSRSLLTFDLYVGGNTSADIVIKGAELTPGSTAELSECHFILSGTDKVYIKVTYALPLGINDGASHVTGYGIEEV